MKVKELIEQLSKYPQDTEVLLSYPECIGDGPSNWVISNDISFYNTKLFKTEYGIYDYTEIYSGGVKVPSTKEDVLILEV
jgi:hypothetical protein